MHARQAGNPVAPDQVEPLVSDTEFDAALPSLDDNSPAPSGDREGAPAPGSTAAQLEGPVQLDPSLDEPLPPLSEFDRTPKEQGKSGPATAQQGRVAYRYRIDGLAGIEGTVDADAIRNRFKGLSALERGKGKAENAAQVSARLAADRQSLSDVLVAAGHFDATIEPAIELPGGANGGTVLAILKVSPGPQYRLGSITFDAPPVEPADIVSRNFGLHPGDPIIADDILAAEAAVAFALPRHGYPFATTGQRDILLDEQAATGDYTLPVMPGPRSSFGDSVVEGEAVFGAGHIDTIARFRKGELYDSRKVDDLRNALLATGLFSVVSVEPRDSGEVAPDGTEYANLVVHQQPGPMRSLSGTVGYGTGQGIRAGASWTHRNLFPPEGALILDAVAGTQEQSASAVFRRSNAGRRDRTVELTLSALHSNYDAYNAYTGRLAGRISFESTRIWQKRLTWSYGFELLASAEESYDFTVGRRARTTYYIAALPAQATFDRTNDLLDPVRGYRLSLKLSPEAALDGGTHLYARGLIEGTAYQPFGGFVLAGRVRLGSIVGASRAEIAPSRRFYAGGGGSVRGYGYQELGPRDPDGNPVGGRSLVEGSVEARYRFGDYGIAAFVDGGQVYAGSTPGFSDLRFGVGIGGRYYTNFGPLRLDVAMPIARQAGESKFAVYVSIGQAF